MKDVQDLFKEYYDSNNLEKNSQYADFSKEQLVIEAEYLHDSLTRILKYINDEYLLVQQHKRQNSNHFQG